MAFFWAVTFDGFNSVSVGGTLSMTSVWFSLSVVPNFLLNAACKLAPDTQSVLFHARLWFHNVSFTWLYVTGGTQVYKSVLSDELTSVHPFAFWCDNSSIAWSTGGTQMHRLCFLMIWQHSYCMIICVCVFSDERRTLASHDQQDALKRTPFAFWLTDNISIAWLYVTGGTRTHAPVCHIGLCPMNWWNSTVHHLFSDQLTILPHSHVDSRPCSRREHRHTHARTHTNKRKRIDIDSNMLRLVHANKCGSYSWCSSWVSRQMRALAFVRAQIPTCRFALFAKSNEVPT